MSITIDLRWVIALALALLTPIVLVGYILGFGLVLGYPYESARAVAVFAGGMMSLAVVALVPVFLSLHDPIPYPLHLFGGGRK